jgi:uroporphyrinogen-III decarboxylase
MLADRVLEHRIEQCKQLAHCGIDMIMISGDIAMQQGMMLSPSMWRKYFKPRLRTWLQEVQRECNIYFMFHSDGNMEAVFGDLVEIGFDVINPIQPECMDVIDIYRRYGNQVCLHGTISCQRTLPFGTPDDVAAEVRQRIACCGQDGGLILSPSNNIQPDVPLENILALYTTARTAPLGG